MSESKAIELIRSFHQAYPPELFPVFDPKEFEALSKQERRLVTRMAGVARRNLCELLLMELERQ